MNMQFGEAGTMTQPVVAPEELTRLAEQWRQSGYRPAASNALGRQQFQALCVAVGRPQLLLDPVMDFDRLPDELRTWASDFNKRDQRQRGLDLHKQLCALAHAGTSNGRQAMLDRLGEIANAWSRSGIQPDATGPLSSGEFVAVCIAANQVAVLQDPIRSFLHLDGWLQEWVLERRGMPGYVGQVVGHPECY